MVRNPSYALSHEKREACAAVISLDPYRISVVEVARVAEGDHTNDSAVLVSWRFLTFPSLLC